MKNLMKNSFSGIGMPSEKDSILEFNQYMKSDKALYIIYAEMESICFN